ncbi:hypothetical protein BH11CYA1_BH11CYA1_45050 [soil metagenome]
MASTAKAAEPSKPIKPATSAKAETNSASSKVTTVKSTKVISSESAKAAISETHKVTRPETSKAASKVSSREPGRDSTKESNVEFSESEREAARARSQRRRHNEDPTPPERLGSEIFTEETPAALLLQAKQYMRHHNYNKALKLLRVALKLNDDDMDIRVLYAEALDEKLSHQAEKEPEIFNECIKSWLMVARQEVGQEKGMTFKGIGFMSGQYADEDWAGKAKKRLRVLTGYSPKPWETDDRFLKKVLRPAETSVSGVIKSSSDDGPRIITSPASKSKTEN